VHLNYRLVEKLITTRILQPQAPKFQFLKAKFNQNLSGAVAGTWHGLKKAWTTITKKLKVEVTHK